MPSQRRLAISRLWVPNLDGFVHTAAGNLFSIGAPRHRKDPEIVRRQDTNQQKLKGKHFGEKKLKKTTYGFECPVTVDSHWQKRNNKNYKKTYGFLCPLSVESHSPDCESQILMALSPLPLAIFFPSGLHATDKTLNLSEVNTQINRSKPTNQQKHRGKNLKKNLHIV